MHYKTQACLTIPNEGIAGTEHELNLAVNSFQKHGRPDVKAFFKRVAGEETETEDAVYIRGIAQRLQPLGLYSVFDSIESLQSKVNLLFQEIIMERSKSHISIEPVTSKHVEVSSSKELISNLLPGNKLILEKGFYDILDFTESTDYVTKKDVYDGEEAVLSGASNVSIIGDSASILVQPRYANVLTLCKCENIKISGISFGHVPHKGSCSGAVIKLVECKNIQFDNCNFFGCGTYGLHIFDSSNIVVNGSRIFNCTYGAISINNSTLLYQNSTITDCICECDSLISIYGGRVWLDNVTIRDNKTVGELFLLFSIKKYDIKHPEKPGEPVLAWLLPRGVCIYNNSFPKLSNEQINTGFLWERRNEHG